MATQLTRFPLLIALAIGPALPAFAQTATPPPAADTGVPAPAPAPPPTAQPPAAADDTLAGKPGSSDNVDEFDLPERVVVTTRGDSTWEKATETLNAAHARLNAAIAAGPAKPSGKPLALFIETDSNGFKFEAMLPVSGLPDGAPLPDGVTAGRTPTGKALRFVHKGPYADIDNTYEAITAYLDGKGYTVKDQFLEEYLVNPKDENDPDLEVNIYVQPR